MCAHVAEVFAVLDPRCFLDIACIRFDDLFKGMLDLAPMAASASFAAESEPFEDTLLIASRCF